MKTTPIFIKILFLSVVILVCLWACQLTQSDRTTQTISFGDIYDSLTKYDSVKIILKDQSGHVVDQVYSGKVDTKLEVNHLPAPHWDGGKIVVEILGFKADKIVYQSDNSFNGTSNKTDSIQFVKLPGTTLIPGTSEIIIPEGDSIVYPIPTVVPDKLSDKSFQWSVSNSEILTLGSKYLIAKHRGIVQLKVSLKADTSVMFIYSISIRANPKFPDSLRIAPHKIVLASHGSKMQVEIKVLPASAIQGVKFKVGDSSIVQLSSNGIIQGLKSGTTMIWTYSISNPLIYDSCSVAVSEPVPIEKISFTKDTLDLFLGGTVESLTVSVTPILANSDLNFFLKDSSIVKISGYNVEPLKEGNTILIAKSVEDPTKTDSLIVNVFPTQKVDSISIKPDSLKLFTGGESANITCTVFPLTTKNLIQIHSDDITIVKVDATGKASPISEGKTLIWAVSRADSTKKAKINVRVKRDPPILVVGQDTIIQLNQSITFLPKVTQEFGGVAMFKWDLNGDGVWDDSSASIKSVSNKYDQEKEYLTSFYVRDTEGNDTTVIRRVKAVSGLVIQILSPLNNSYFHTPVIDISWMVNGKIQDSLLKAVLVSGANIISRSAKDALGNIISASVTVYFDTVPP